LGFPVDLERVVDEIDHPVVRERSASIESRLGLATDSVGGLRDLDDQHGT